MNQEKKETVTNAISLQKNKRQAARFPSSICFVSFIRSSAEEIMGGYFTLTLLVLIFDGVFGVEVKRVMEGDPVTLNSNVTKQQDEPMRWYFKDTLIAHINDDPSKSRLYDGKGGIFRDRLDVNYETGSLTITNTRSEHAGHYELEYNRKSSPGTSERLNNSKSEGTRIISKRSSSDEIKKSFRLIVTDSGPSAGVVAGIVVAVLLVFGVAAGVVGVILYRRRTAKKGEKKNNQETDGEKSNEDPLMKPVV